MSRDNDTPNSYPQQRAIIAIDHPHAAPIAADRAVFEGHIRVGPFLIDKFIAVNETRNVLKFPVSPPQIDGHECIPVAHRLNHPIALLTAQAATPIEISEPPNEALAAFNIGKLVDNKLQREGIDADVVADAAHLRDTFSVAQKKMLLAIDCL